MLIAVLPFLLAGQLTIVCFGDSTTAPRRDVVPYCEQLAAPGRTMLNRGVPGNTTEHARARFDRDVLGANPDVVIVQFGINDSTVDVWKAPPVRTPRVLPGRFRENLEHFLDTLTAKGARVILMTFNPLHWTPRMVELYGRRVDGEFIYDPADAAGFEAHRQQYLEIIREVGQAPGRRSMVAFLDVRPLYQGRGVELIPDGVHPNTAAHKRLSEAIGEVLVRMGRTGR